MPHQPPSPTRFQPTAPAEGAGPLSMLPPETQKLIRERVDPRAAAAFERFGGAFGPAGITVTRPGFVRPLIRPLSELDLGTRVKRAFEIMQGNKSVGSLEFTVPKNETGKAALDFLGLSPEVRGKQGISIVADVLNRFKERFPNIDFSEFLRVSGARMKAFGKALEKGEASEAANQRLVGRLNLKRPSRFAPETP